MVNVHPEETLRENNEPSQNVDIVPQNVQVVPQNVQVVPQNVQVDPQNVQVVPQNVQVQEITNVLCCDKCNRTFTRNDNLKRHMLKCIGNKHSCKCNYCNKVLSNRSSKSEHQKICKERNNMQVSTIPITDSNVSIVNNNNNTVTNNIQNANAVNTGTVNNNTVNINIHNFGQESMGHINSEFLEKCIRMKSHNSIFEVFKKVGLDPDIPENHNIRVYSQKRDQMCVYKDNRWTLQDKNATLNEIVQMYNDLLVNFYNNNEHLQKEDIEKEAMELRLKLRDIAIKSSPKEHVGLCRQLFTSILDLGVLQGYRLQMTLVPISSSS